MQCDGTPDPTSLPEINTFVSLWNDERHQINVDHTLQQTNLVLSLIRELNRIISSIPADASEMATVPVYKQVRATPFASRPSFRSF